MKPVWKKPQIKIEGFVANEYVSTCWCFEATGVVIQRPDKDFTDGRSDSPSPWQGPNKGFNDDGWDYLTASHEDVMSATSLKGWYSTTTAQVHPNSKEPTFYDGPHGFKTKQVRDIVNGAYYYGDWPKQLGKDGFSVPGFGPNAS